MEERCCVVVCRGEGVEFSRLGEWALGLHSFRVTEPGQ